MEDMLTCCSQGATFSQVFGRQGQLMQATVQSLNSLNDQIAQFMVSRPRILSHDERDFLTGEQDPLTKSMTLMRHLLMDAQGKILKMMEDNKQLGRHIDGAIRSAGQEVSNLRSELTATNCRLAGLGAGSPAALENHHHRQHKHHADSLRYRDPAVHHRQKTVVTDMCYPAEISSLMDFGSPDCSLGKVLLHEEVAQLQEEVHLLRQMKDMLGKDLQEESQGGGTAGLLSAAELHVQLGDKEQELDRAKEALQAMKADRKRLKGEKGDLVSQMQQLYTTLESREDQLREFIRNYDQHRKESEDAVRLLAKEKDVLEREKWDLRRQTKEATEQANILRSQLDMKENRIKELEAELTMAKQSLATLTKDVPKRHSLASTNNAGGAEPVVNGSQEWVMQADLPLTAAIRQSQQTLYHGHNADRQAVVRVSPCHSRQPSVISDASAADGDRSSTPSDINSPRHRTHSLCNSMEDLEEQKRKKKKEKMTLGSLSRVFARGKQRKSLDPGLFDDCEGLMSDNEEQLDRLQQAALTRTTCMSLWRAGAVQAWLEVVMGMPMYTRACSENVKSGKVLLGLTDEDLEMGLGISNPIHRRKLRLAIEDYRRAERDQGLSKSSDMDHHWVSTSWLSDVGLPQYSQTFHGHLVDGRVLSSLGRRDLERYLDVSDRSHQTSLLLSVQLLQVLGFRKEALQARRAKCEQQDRDPIVWTCHRVRKWIRDIDLKEFADNLQGKGVNGAVLILDPAFDADAMARALEIPVNKHMLHRHLREEMKALTAASSNVEQECEVVLSSTPVAVHRFGEGRVPMRRSSKSPLRFRAASRPAEARVQSGPRTSRGPVHARKSVEITNV
ncbi:kazrin, periplakin interacting protein b isoform X3 [Phycodurus eques]|uniref:kazrin, periplakin interacting protein b isoform X3 n=1 Tax=Phycodurus eques TaxID=693459 RepID=UPI002ACEADE1|nr:kazrin, periplakin interacting protein b isoform X3 [Phycodurus eques]